MMEKKSIIAVIIVSALLNAVILPTLMAEDSLNNRLDGKNRSNVTLIDQGFEEPGWTWSTPPTGWTTNSYFYFNSLYGNPHTGNHHAYSNSNLDSMVSPIVTFGADTELSFWYATESGFPQSIEVYIDGQADGNLIWSDTNYINLEYEEVIVDLSSYSGDHYIEFINNGQTALYGQVIDDIKITSDIDIEPPVISNVDAQPSVQIINGNVEITCMVTDESGVDEVYANITFPDTTIQINPMIGSGSSYSFEQQYTLVGTYDYYIWAKDNNDNDNESIIYHFEIKSPPNAGDDSDSCEEDEYTWTNVINNDEDTDGDLVFSTLEILTGPDFGNTIVNTTTGEIQYNPNPNWFGTDSYEYRIADDDGLTDTAVVSITVSPVNDIVEVTNIPDFTIKEGESFITLDLDDYVTDVEDNDADIQWSYTGNTDLDVSINSNHIVSISIPDSNWNGLEIITFTAEDTEGSTDKDDATFAVTAVNDVPVVGDIPDQSVSEGENFVSFDLDDYVFDVETPDASIVWSYSGNVEMTVSIDPVSHVVLVSYPGGEWSGSDTIVFSALDDGDGVNGPESASDSALFSVGAVNDPPVANDDSASCVEDEFVWIDVLANDTDIDGSINPLTVSIGIQPTDGSINVNTTTGEIQYIPDDDYNGIDSFTYTVRDDLGEVSNQATVTIQVYPVNDDPTASYVYEPTNPSTSDIIYFNSTSNDVENDLENWTWNMNDGTILYGEKITHQYDTGGSFQVELTVRDGQGSTDSTVQTVIVATIEVIDINQSVFERGFRLMPEWFAAQEFIPTLGTLTKIDLFVSKMGMPTGEVTFQICENKVNGTVLIETTITPDDAPHYPNYEWLTIDLEQLQIDTTEQYYIVLKNATGSDTHNFIQWGWCDSYPDGAGGPYDGGWFYFLDEYSIKWSPIRDWDYTFKIYGY